GAWTLTQALPYTDAAHMSVAYNGYIYTIAGITGAGTTSSVVFAPINATGSLGAWSFTQPLPYASADSFGAAAYNGYLYVTGGTVNGGTTSSVVFAPINATGSLGAWSFAQPMPYIIG